MSTITSEKIFNLIFLFAVLLLAGCRLGNGLSVGPEGSLFGIPVEIGYNQPLISPSPRAGHVSAMPQTEIAANTRTTSAASSPIQQVGFEKPSDIPSAWASLDTTTQSAQIEEKGWIRDIRPVEKWQWHNPKMDELLLLPVDYRPDFEEILQASPDPLMRANAAIVLAHGEKIAPELLSQPLLNAIHSSLPINMRCAALEAYAMLETTSPSDLDAMFETYYEKKEEKRVNPGKPELILELLCHLPKKKPFRNERCYVDPLTSLKPQLRQAVLELWRDHATEASEELVLPETVVACCYDRSPQIRAMAMETLARWQHPETMRIFEQGLRDPNAIVRGAAVHGLGILNTEESISMLTPLLKNHSRHIRASVAKAFYEAGQLEQLFRMTDDEAYEVRCVVASGIARADNAQGLTIARKYMSDPSPDVQEAMLQAISHWNPERSFPIYMEMLDAREGKSRHVTYKILVRLWPEIEQYEYASHDPAEKRRETVATIRQVCNMERIPQLLAQHQNFDAKPANMESATSKNRSSGQTRRQVAALLREHQTTEVPIEMARIESQLIALGPECLEMIESLVLTESQQVSESLLLEVLPHFDVAFEHLGKLQSDQTATRRIAASSLVAEANTRMLSPLIYACLEHHIQLEQDEIVQIRLWELVGKQAGSEFIVSGDHELFWNFAAIFTLHSLAQNSPELKRRACEYLKEHGHPDDVELLIDELMDPKPSVIRSAIQAMAALDGRAYTDLLRPLLNDPQPAVVIDTALALHRFDDSTGTDALQRLAYHHDRGVRLALVQGIRQTDDPALIPILVQMLDNAGSLRSEILNTLPQLAGHDIAAPQDLAGMSVEERIQRWKAFRM